MNLNKNGKNKKIAVIEVSPTDTLTKLAFIFRKEGYKTALISFTHGIGDNFTSAGYNEIINFDAKFLKTGWESIPSAMKLGIKKMPIILKNLWEIKKLRPSAVIVRTTPNWLYFLAKKFFRDVPVIYFPFDIRSFAFRNRKEAHSLGIPNFEIDAEAWAFNNADGIIHKGTNDELYHLDPKVLGKIKIKCPEILVLPYALNEIMAPLKGRRKFSEKDINIVYVGHVPADERWLKNIVKITEQGIYVHFYTKTNALTVSEDNKRIREGCSSVMKNKFVKFHEPVSQADLPKEISKYDYGFYGFNEPDSRHYNFTTGNKIASYLEAGLPIIAAPQYLAVADMIKKHGIGFLIGLNELDKLRKIIIKNKPNKFKKNIAKARKSLEFGAHMPRIKEFLNLATKYYNSKKC